MRVVPSEMYNDLLSNLQSDRQSINQSVLEASSGKSVNNPSDNPVAAGQFVLENAQIADIDQFTYSASTVQGSLNTAQSALDSVVNTLTQAVSVGTEAAGGTLSSSELGALGEQVSQLKQQVQGLANTTYQGNYIFAGTAVTTMPYQTSSSSTSGVAYMGSETTNTVEVGEGQTAALGLPGSQIFGGTGTDVFQSLQDLSHAIQSNNGVAGAITEVQSALNNVIAQRTSYGDTLQQLNSDTSSLGQEKLTVQELQTNLIGADQAQVATTLSQSETTLQAAIAAASKVTQDSLINYMT